jgi:hypothetical protein
LVKKEPLFEVIWPDVCIKNYREHQQSKCEGRHSCGIVHRPRHLS